MLESTGVDPVCRRPRESEEDEMGVGTTSCLLSRRDVIGFGAGT
jgi:hypothetical protein